MKCLKWFFLPTLALLVILNQEADATGVDTLKRREVKTVSIGIFWPPVWAHTNKKQYRYIKRANVHLIQNVSSTELTSRERNLKMLDLAGKFGLKVSVADDRVNGSETDVSAMVHDYGKHPATAGYYIRDEPGAAELEKMAGLYQRVLRYDSSKVPYLNLFPLHAVKDYEKEYVEKWIKTVGSHQLKVLSFDHYALMEDGSFGGGYFHNLEIIRKLGLKYRVPTSSYLQSIGIRGAYRRPNPAELSYSAYSNLAYGIKNPVWFTYWTPTDRGEPFTEAIIDPHGKKTDLYRHFKRVNNEIEKLGKTLVHLDAVAVYHTGQVPSGTFSVPEDFWCLPEDVKQDLILSDFRHVKHNDRQYLMVVNKDLKASKTVSLQLKNVGLVAEVSKRTGRERYTSPDTNQLEILLKPGDGRLFFFKMQ